MKEIILLIFRRIFYNPLRHFQRMPFSSMGADAVILSTCRFSFSSGEKQFEGKIQLGKDSMVGCEFIFESGQGEVVIGERTFINAGTRLIARSAIRIGDNVTIAWGCTIYDHNSHSLCFIERRKDIERQSDSYRLGRSFIESKDWSSVKSKPIVIGNDAWIGFNVTILNGVTIGEGAVVGAGSVVRENVEPWTVVAGNPAVFLKRIER